MLDNPSGEARINAIDVFCGAGGLSYGLKKAGIRVTAGLDLDPACDYPFSENIGGDFIQKNLTETSARELVKFFPDGGYSLLAGCAPCQPFSTLSNGRDRKGSKKWPLVREFSRLVKELKPDFVTMENVPILRTQSIFVEFLGELKSEGYNVCHSIVDAAEYGVPQRRRRLIVLASQRGPVRLATPDELGLKRKTVREAISALPRLASGQVDPNDSLHRARKLTDINLRRIRASKPGSTWEDWPEELRLECHKRETGSTFKSVYGRMEWDKPSGTMTTQSYNFGTGRFGHPEQDRSLSLREMAILQSFPDDYKFTPPDAAPDFTNVGRLIGNAVPVGLGFAIGKSVQLMAQEASQRNE